jgi:hypothetical protein
MIVPVLPAERSPVRFRRMGVQPAGTHLRWA